MRWSAVLSVLAVLGLIALAGCPPANCPGGRKPKLDVVHIVTAEGMILPYERWVCE
jgi:hypothetical protein